MAETSGRRSAWHKAFPWPVSILESSCCGALEELEQNFAAALRRIVLHPVSGVLDIFGSAIVAESQARLGKGAHGEGIPFAPNQQHASDDPTVCGGRPILAQECSVPIQHARQCA